MTLFLETGQYFMTSQNGIEDKKNGTEGVINVLNDPLENNLKVTTALKNH